MKNIEARQWAFINNEILGLVIRNAFSRNPIHPEGATEQEKQEFRIGVKRLLVKATTPYTKRDISPEEHLSNAEVFQSNIEKESGRTITFGTAQKLLNLYLKYLWCLGRLKKAPPDCPIDSIVLGEIKEPNPSWTRPEFTKKIYIDRVRKIQGVAKGDLAVWELEMFNRRNPAYGHIR